MSEKYSGKMQKVCGRGCRTDGSLGLVHGRRHEKGRAKKEDTKKILIWKRSLVMYLPVLKRGLVWTLWTDLFSVDTLDRPI